jgi:hypothetical protein
MSISYLVFNKQSGRITKRVVCPENVIGLQCSSDEDYMVGDVLDTRLYVHHGRIIPRPLLPVVRKGHILTGIPAGAEVLIEDATYIADGKPLELEFSLPGTYLIQVRCWPYLDWETTFEN